MTNGEKIAEQIRPLIKGDNVDIVCKALATLIDHRYSYIIRWTLKGKFVFGGLHYRKGQDDDSALVILKNIYNRDINP